ncbi:folate-binding protein [Nitratireductor sp. CAU 1489]|uniref:Folate-binding protein n=1 Tax=Nitratireductor arenosus TaxID=2682096 RepID=A0A844QM61_9HYPH|nr:folate-binding protein YgfZ [Nitratireductor arenosus]MVA99664.1 folate-binding protein [Nitratireductor arenosus]
MPTTRLDDRALLSVHGPDAESLLQNVVTPDLAALGESAVKPGALLTPQGKILFDFLIARDGEAGFVLECRADIAEDFLRRLMLYKLRAKVDLTKQDQGPVLVSWQNESDGSHPDSSVSHNDSGVLTDTRFPERLSVRRHHHPAPDARPDANGETWTRLRIEHGVAESGTDYALGDVFPHDVLLDQNGGVGLRKGCFVGQEVVSRMHHRGTARRRLLIARAASPLPAPGTSVTADGRAIGTLGSVAGGTGLAIVRIDRVKEAIDAGTTISAGAVGVTLEIPPGMGFSFPEPAAGGADR